MKILLVEDEKISRITLTDTLTKQGYQVTPCETGRAGREALEKYSFEVVITDLRLPDLNGLELVKLAKMRENSCTVIVITGFATVETAVAALKLGAYDYLTKPFSPDKLLSMLANIQQLHSVIRENIQLKKQITHYQGREIIGSAAVMQRLVKTLRSVAATDHTVLIEGESGTGKELVAHFLHQNSERGKGPFVAVNCAVLPESLLESELFGHEKGSFTGALKRKIGRVEEADGGTIFLDEIGDMSRPLQAKLLRFLEDGTFTRIGGNEELQVNVRLVAATNRDIVEAIRQETFREDLFHRLNVVQFCPPPLRERGEDVMLLAQFFLRQFAAALNKTIEGFSESAVQKLTRHHWPGNVRELRNAIERAVILERGKWISPENLPSFQIESRLRKDTINYLSFESYEEILEDCERNMLLNALELCDYSLPRTAECLKITEALLKKKAQKLNLIVGSTGPGSRAAK